MICQLAYAYRLSPRELFELDDETLATMAAVLERLAE